MPLSPTIQNTRPFRASAGSHTLSINLFSFRLKAILVLITVLLSMAEVISSEPKPVFLFWLYYGAKVAAFFILGYLAPLAFHSLNENFVGVLGSFVWAIVIESIQSVLYNGHSFHWYELAGKIALISLGFVLALERRYEQRISLGPLSISLHLT